MSITTRAAIARAPHVGWEIADLQLDEPKAHEVRVKLMAAGLCHSDDHITTGDAPIRLPVVGGHEGAGIVESVGPNVQRVKPGDKIVCSYIPACGACRPCSTGHQNMCVKGLNAGTGMFEDGTWRFHLGDQDLGGFCTLQEHDDVAAFLKEHPMHGVLRASDRALESIEVCTRARPRLQREIHAWLQKHR